MGSFRLQGDSDRLHVYMSQLWWTGTFKHARWANTRTAQKATQPRCMPSTILCERRGSETGNRGQGRNNFDVTRSANKNNAHGATHDLPLLKWPTRLAFGFQFLNAATFPFNCHHLIPVNKCLICRRSGAALSIIQNATAAENGRHCAMVAKLIQMSRPRKRSGRRDGWGWPRGGGAFPSWAAQQRDTHKHSTT